MGIVELATREYDAYPDMSPEDFLVRLFSYRTFCERVKDYNAMVKREEERVMLEEVLGTAYVYVEGLRQSKRMN